VTVVSNASPLITLFKVGALHVLPALFEKVLVATEVFHEITVTGVGRPGATDVQGASWIEVKSYTNAAQFARWRAQRGLGAGETATILLAQELSANLAIIDERTARGFATSLGVNVMGCVGILESAARKNLIADLRGTYQKLIGSGTYIDPAILNRSLTAFKLPTL
jgi:predicted nucleic acid-binding protein